MDAPPVQYATTNDGWNIACSISGAGRPLILVPEPVSHIQLYWTADTYMRPWLQGLSNEFRLVLYDGRGQGMSSHGLSADHSLADELRDLEAVTEHLGLLTFVLLGRGPVAVMYAVAHPERVEALILVATPASWAAGPTAWSDGLASQDWDLFLQTLAGLTSPSDSQSVERLRQATTQQDWLARGRAAHAFDLTKLLPTLQTAVLVLHPRDYPIFSLEESRKVVAAIPGAKMAVIEGATSRGDPEQGIRAIRTFLDAADLSRKSQSSGAPDGARPGLSSRELEVLRLIAAGRRNSQIAEALVISPNTVARHVSNIFDKIGAANRVEATVYARDHGLT